MKAARHDKAALRSLTKRYLFWLFKTTKDELDRIDRKFTQLEVDRELEAFFRRHGRGLEPFVKEWEDYIAAKEAEANKMKWGAGGALRPSYVFLRLKLESILRITRRRFGARVVEEFTKTYEDAALRRILSDTSGQR